MITKCFARLYGPYGQRDFEIVGYNNGMYDVYIDFIFPMALSRIIVKECKI